MLKCGQKDNTNYTFGLTKEQREEIKTVTKTSCSLCGNLCKVSSNYCPHCGAKLDENTQN